jgi:disulfide bond formation protein DsbB
MAAPVVRCDEVAWTFAGLSMAEWNAALSFALAALWIAAARRAWRA